MLFGKRTSREAFEKQAKDIFPSIFGTALRLTRSRDDAEDLAQEAIVRAYEAYDRFDGQNFKAWMLRIVLNVYLSRYRKDKRAPALSSLDAQGAIEPMGPSEGIPDRILFDGLVGSQVEKALLNVPEDFRIAVLLRDVEGLSYDEIADMTDTLVGTVRSRIARGRASLRKQLLKYALKQGYLKESDLL